MRILQKQSRFCSVSEIYVSFNTLFIPELQSRQILILVHNSLYNTNLLPDVFANYFTLNSSVHPYLTRTHSDIHMNRANTSFGQRYVTYKGGILWNSLPSDLILTLSIHLTSLNRSYCISCKLYVISFCSQYAIANSFQSIFDLIV